MPGDFGGVRLLAIVQDDRRQLHQRRRRFTGIAFKITKARHRIIVEIEGARLDQVEEGLTRQAVALDHRQQRDRDGMRADIPPHLPGQTVAPPLKPHLARQGIADDITHPRDLHVEGIERVDRRSIGGRNEQPRQKSILVPLTHDVLTMSIAVDWNHGPGSRLGLWRAHSIHRDERRRDPAAFS